MEKQFEVIIVGSGPAGIYFGWKIAQKGHSVCIIEKDPKDKVGHRLDSFHIDSDKFDEFDIPPPSRDSPELITIFEHHENRSPFGNYPKHVPYSFHVMRLPFFLQRMISLAESAGVTFCFSSEFVKFLFQDQKIIGITIRSDGIEEDIHSRLVIDATGPNAILRRNLPPDYGIETFELGPDDKFYVILRYINWKKPVDSPPSGSISWTFYKSWLAPAPDGSDGLLGVGQPVSFEQGEVAFQDFLQTISLPPFEIVKIEKGITPYHRPPFSVVGDGILILGDAACLTKPFSGEGITAGWRLAKIALSVVDSCLQKSAYLSQSALWEINTQYFTDQGAKFAALLSQIPGATNTTKKEMEYLFKHDIIFSSEDFTAMNTHYEMELSFSKILKIAGTLLWGVIIGVYSLRSFKALLGSLGISGKLKTHYENYPRKVDEFPAWVEKAQNLWNKVPKMRLSTITK